MAIPQDYWEFYEYMQDVLCSLDIIEIKGTNDIVIIVSQSDIHHLKIQKDKKGYYITWKGRKLYSKDFSYEEYRRKKDGLLSAKIL